ncbi:MAG: tetratricopeptide repeat protein [Actinomycetota bacterium]|nr:tetratricopeptide repeat protein [Actinomycetota bacterium]
MSEHQKLITRANNAVRIGDGGDAHGALRLFKQLLPDQQRVLGANHPAVLTIRHNIAYWTGQTRDARAALELFEQLLPDQQRVLGADHPNVLTPVRSRL